MNHPFLALDMYMQARHGVRNDPRCVREVAVVALEVMKEGTGERESELTGELIWPSSTARKRLSFSDAGAVYLQLCVIWVLRAPSPLFFPSHLHNILPANPPHHSNHGWRWEERRGTPASANRP